MCSALSAPETNEAVSQHLDNIARMLALKREEPFRIRAYTDAARAIATLPEDIREHQRAGTLEEIDGVGPSIAARIAEYLEAGRSTIYDELKQELAPTAPALLDVPSIGPHRAELIRQRLGITTIAALLQAAGEHRLQTVSGIGAALEGRIAREAERAMRLARVLHDPRP
ncbi:MAG: hypothetical protein IT306_24600 [Chloroflexi bacterium]|nr:hypothetical protein [Chloroflexota bacterium]